MAGGRCLPRFVAHAVEVRQRAAPVGDEMLNFASNVFQIQRTCVGLRRELPEQHSGVAHARFRPAQCLYDIGLSLWSDLAVTGEGGQHTLMPEILAPGLELLGGPAPFLT
jgi:hypothetical protein